MPRVKSRNYAEAYKLYAAQVIPQIDPREIGSTFHGAQRLRKRAISGWKLIMILEKIWVQ